MKKDSSLPTKKKVVFIISFKGTNFLGSQINNESRTVEGEFFEALKGADIILDTNKEEFSKIGLGRISRVDKGVHAVCFLLSAKVIIEANDPTTSPKENSRFGEDKIKEALSSIFNKQKEITLHNLFIASKKLKLRRECSQKTYKYIFPSATINNFDIEYLTTLAQKFVNPKKYHNFTSKISFNDPQAYRTIRKVEIIPMDGFEKNAALKEQRFVCIQITGQSFMKNQIRKMVAVVFAIIHFNLGIEDLDKCFEDVEVNTPIAPAQGLYLYRMHFFDNKKEQKVDRNFSIPDEVAKCCTGFDAFEKEELWPLIMNIEYVKKFSEWLEYLGKAKDKFKNFLDKLNITQK